MVYTEETKRGGDEKKKDGLRRGDEAKEMNQKTNRKGRW